MVPSTRLGKEGGARNGARETAIYEPTRVNTGEKEKLRSIAARRGRARACEVRLSIEHAPCVVIHHYLVLGWKS